MRILITGGGGFLGQKLAKALAKKGSLSGRGIAEIVLADLVAPRSVDADLPVTCRAADVADPAQVNEMFTGGFDVVFHLAAVVSGQAEADLELGLSVNLMGTLNILRAAAGLRAGVAAPVRVVYASSLAVHGGEVPDPVPEGAELNPQSSYGSQKAAGELLLQDFSRRGLVDGVGLRLPTVTIRPGKANAAASSFMSSIFRDTMEGRSANCPVERDYLVFHSAPRTVVQNLVHGAEVAGDEFGYNRNINLPGRSDTIGQMIDAMEAVAGPEPVSRITWHGDPAVEAITKGWRGRVQHEKAVRLGFVGDESFENSVRWFLEDDLNGPR